jgi:hypothetical protein
MAKALDFPLLPRIVVSDSYAMIGETHINHFHQTVEIHVYIFESEDARHQRLAPSEVDLHRPMKIIILRPTISEYQDYFDEPARVLAAVGYRLAGEVEEGAGANPRGLKNLLKEARDV